MHFLLGSLMGLFYAKEFDCQFFSLGMYLIPLADFAKCGSTPAHSPALAFLYVFRLNEVPQVAVTRQKSSPCV